MGLLREHSTETGVPTTQYTVVAAGDGAFHIDMTIVSSPALAVPTTHVALHVRCHKGEAFVAGMTTSKDPGFTDSPLAVCNNARQADILLAVEAIPTIGRDPEQFDASPSTLQKLKTICWERIRKAETKGQRQVQADHSADVTAAMEQVTVKLASPSTTGLSSPCSGAGNAGRMTFPAPFFGDGCVAPSGHYFAEDPRENQLLPQLYTLGRYLMLTSARRHMPNLQGLWAEGVKSEWNGDYHLNINLQMMYWAAASAFPAGKETQILMPLITFMEELATMGRKTAQDMYAKASESAFFKQHLSEHAWVAHGFTDTTLRSDALADLQWSLCVSCGAWAATHIFDVLLYGDLTAIEPSTALKILEIFRGIADFFEAHLFVLPNDPESQTLYTGPTTSPENSYWTMRQSTSDGNGNGNGNGKKSNFFNIDLISSPPPPKPAMGTAYLTFSPAIDVSVLREFSNAYYLLATWTSGQVSDLNQQRFDYSRQAVDFQQLVSKMTNHGLPQTYTSIPPSLNPRVVPGKNPASVLFTSEATSTVQCHRIHILDPTPVQKAVIPRILSNENVVMTASTGSGKTLAYILPALQSMQNEEMLGYQRSVKRPRCLVLVPTRELARQVLGAVKGLGHHAKVSSTAVIGGEDYSTQKMSLNRMVDIVVASPGRLMQHRQRGNVFFSNVNKIIIDEVDTMLTQGFGGDIRGILKNVFQRAERTNVDSGNGDDVSFNELTGPIPDIFDHLPHLRVLNLAGNSFEGELPPSFYALTALEEARLQNNRFTGEISPDLTKLVSLRHANFSQNKFSGGHNHFFFLENLEMLQLNNNEFKGRLTPEIYRARKLLVLQMQTNKLSGCLPDEICALQRLRILNLSDNAFRGLLPDQIGNMAALEVLLLGENNFLGPVPLSLSQLPKLRDFTLFKPYAADWSEPKRAFDKNSFQRIFETGPKFGVDSVHWNFKTIYGRDRSVQDDDTVTLFSGIL
eukprot:gene3160-2325_t